MGDQSMLQGFSTYSATFRAPMSHFNEPMIYLDYHATTPIDPRVVELITELFTTTFGNPNSVDHAVGTKAQEVVNTARSQVAELVGALPDDVQFTSGSSESLELALRHALRTRPNFNSPLRVASTPVEHRALLDLLHDGEVEGVLSVQWLQVDRRAQVNVKELIKVLPNIDLLCVIAGNNEVGTLNPIEEIAAFAQEKGVSLLVDATQTAGREFLDVREWNLTYTVLSAHKMYGPKGVGALVVSEDVRGKAPQALKRHGTPNVPLIGGMGEAARLRIAEMDEDEKRIRALRDNLQAQLMNLVPGLIVNGDLDRRLSHNLHISVPGIPNDAVTARLHDQVAISTGSACTSGTQEPSHVLKAMNLPQDVQDGALRISVGKFTTATEVNRAALLISGAIAEVRNLTGWTT